MDYCPTLKSGSKNNDVQDKYGFYKLTLSQKFLKIAYSYFIFSSVDKLQIKTLIWPYEPA
jgi:hypothetical protein